MIRKALRYLYLGLNLALVALIAACSDEEEAVVSLSQAEAPEVHVNFSVGTELMEGNADTRATSPRIPDVENLIYDVWILQYTKDAGFALLSQKHVYHLNTDATTGSTSLSWPSSEVSFLGMDSYICVIANRNPGNPTQDRTAIYDSEEDALNADIFSNFKSTLVTVPIEGINEGTVDQILMCGYWEGKPTEGASINVTLGRMIARLNVTITNSASNSFSVDTKNNLDRRLTIKLQNVPTKTYLFPSVDAAPLDATYDGYNYITLKEDEVVISKGKSISRYYYVAPNYCTTEEGATNFYFQYNNNKTTSSVLDLKSATIVLGTDAPGTSNRDLNLYHNTIYNFTITLK